MLEKLKEWVLEANLRLDRYKLARFTWGNASGIDRDNGLVVIKPSGVAYEKLKTDDLAVLDLDGNLIEGHLRPSSDTPTHLMLYRHFPNIGGVVHTHSVNATAWSQAGKPIPALGTTHADYFNGEIPCTRKMTPAEISGAYERETGNLIVETFKNIDPADIPGVLVRNHGPFCWGKDPLDAVENAAVLEEIAKLACITRQIDSSVEQIDALLLDKHFSRKHGSSAYYGQKVKS